MTLPARIVDLAEALRAEGLAIGTSELLDAFAALDEVPWTDRTAFKEALAIFAADAGALVADGALGILERGGLGGAEEPAVEDQLEQPSILLRLCEGARQRLAKVLALAPGNDLERGEGVEDLGGADRHALGAELLAEGDDLGGEPRSPSDLR